MKRNIALSIGTGLTIAVILWLSLDASDAIFQSRLLPWVHPLIYLQDVGFTVASHFFPCQKEGFDTGCEAYKIIPAFVGTNVLLYTIVSLPVIWFLQMAMSIGYEVRTLPRGVRLLAGTTGCVTGIAFVGLSGTLSLLGLFLILGAVLADRLPFAGRWLIVGSALFASVFILPICLSHPVEIISGPFLGAVAPVRLRSIGGPHDLTFLPMSLSWLLSPLMLLWCDTALLIEAAKGRLARPALD